MALISLHFTTTPSSFTLPKQYNHLSSTRRLQMRSPTTVKSYKVTIEHRKIPKLTRTSLRRNRHSSVIYAIEERRQETESESESSPEPEIRPAVEVSELGKEIKKAMEERKMKEEEGGGGDFWGGVAAEVREIEWPAFGKVIGTTGVVLGVIAGSSVVLLTVNAVLAELSDRVFAGRGVQDFFG